MSFDLAIKNGTVIDGSGMARYRADVGVKDGKITHIGRISEPADEVIDAEGHVVTPGFVDGHTHMDAQIFWDQLGSCSCYHGVTTVVMGNCGFTLAPCRETEVDFVFRNLERAEDISRDAMLEGIDWRWETFPEFLDVLDTLPKGINYSGYIGHSALRTYVMGERAFEEEAGEDDLDRMVKLVQEAVKAGALGFSTSRSPSHMTSDDRLVASRVAPFSEIQAIVSGMGEIDAGIFQLAMERGELDYITGFYQSLVDLSIETGRPVTFGSLSRRRRPGQWRALYDIIEEGNRNGARLFTQVHSREINSILSFETGTPFDNRGRLARGARPAAGGAEGGAARPGDQAEAYRERRSARYRTEGCRCRGAAAGMGHLLCHGQRQMGASQHRGYREGTGHGPRRDDDRPRA